MLEKNQLQNQLQNQIDSILRNVTLERDDIKDGFLSDKFFKSTKVSQQQKDKLKELTEKLKSI